MATLQVVIMTTSSAASDEKFINMTAVKSVIVLCNIGIVWSTKL